MKKLRGIIPVLVSPVNQDGSLDEQGYHGLLEYTLKHPIGGYWMLGSAGEDFMMTHRDRVRATKIISDYVAGKVPVIVGCGHPVWEEMCQFFDDTADMGFDAYHLLPTDRKMRPPLARKYIQMVADRAPKPIWLYNNELRALKIPVDVVADLKSHPNIAGIKAAGYDMKDIVPFCMMHSDDFQTIGSGGGHFLAFMAMGCDAHTISPACCWPGEYCQMYEYWLAGKLEQARELAFKIGRVIKALPHPINTEFSAEEKAVLEVLGVCKRYVYPPFFHCTDEEMAQTRKVLQDANLL
jgi:4-hydroxy-tetrahydrodipicolinate synthase